MAPWTPSCSVTWTAVWRLAPAFGPSHRWPRPIPAVINSWKIEFYIKDIKAKVWVSGNQAFCWKETLFFVPALVWIYRERKVHIFLCVLSVLYTASVLILHRRNFSSSAITPYHMLIRLNFTHACWGLDCDLQLNEEKNEARISTRAFSLKRPSKESQRSQLSPSNPHSLV